jgi:hypothetical protein
VDTAIRQAEKMTTRKSIATIAMVVLAFGGVAIAHEGHSHAKTHKMMGTVKAVHADMNHVEITTRAGKTDGFYVNEQTKYLRGNTKASLSDITPGTRVIVDAKMDGQKMLAAVVKLGGATKAISTGSGAP